MFIVGARWILKHNVTPKICVVSDMSYDAAGLVKTIDMPTRTCIYAYIHLDIHERVLLLE